MSDASGIGATAAVLAGDLGGGGRRGGLRGSGVRIGAIVRKEFRHLFRDPRLLLIVLVMPVMQLLLFAYAISFDVKHIPTLVLDRDNTAASRAYVQTYTASGFFDVVGRVPDLAAVDDAFERGSAQVAVVIPPGYADTLAHDGSPQVAVLVDGSEPNAARIGTAYATALNATYGQRLTATWAERQGYDTGSVARIEPRVRTWYNPDRVSSIFLIPGLIVAIIAIVTVQQTAVTLVRERDQGTQEQLMVSPLRGWELMVGKLLPWTLLAFLDILVVIGIGRVVFALPMRGSWLLLAVAAIAFVFCSLGMGLLISAVAPSIEVANIAGLLGAFLPAFLLSGLAFPLGSIPLVLQGFSALFPARYMVTISRGVFLKGAGLGELWPQLAALTAYAIVVVGLAVVLTRRRSRQ